MNIRDAVHRIIDGLLPKEPIDPHVTTCREVLELIYKSFDDLSVTEGAFYASISKMSDGIFASYGGINVFFDNSSEIFSVSIPVKFSVEFKYAVKDLIDKAYDVLSVKYAGYTMIIEFAANEELAKAVKKFAKA